MPTAFQGSKCVRGGLKRREYQVNHGTKLGRRLAMIGLRVRVNPGVNPNPVYIFLAIISLLVLCAVGLIRCTVGVGCR